MDRIKKTLINGMMSMVKKISLLGLSVLLLSHTAVADDSNPWVGVASGKGVNSYVKKGTFHNSNGSSSILLQLEDTNDKSITYYQVSIKNKDCDNGYGKLSYFDLDGRLAFKADYVSQGSSVAATIGDVLCSVKNAIANEQKS